MQFLRRLAASAAKEGRLGHTGAGTFVVSSAPEQALVSDDGIAALKDLKEVPKLQVAGSSKTGTPSITDRTWTRSFTSRDLTNKGRSSFAIWAKRIACRVRF